MELGLPFVRGGCDGGWPGKPALWERGARGIFFGRDEYFRGPGKTKKKVPVFFINYFVPAGRRTRNRRP
jgi:hypothetical protein